jgi:hypothetical protein
MMVYFVFRGDKIDLYNTIFELKKEFTNAGINYLDLIRNIDSILVSNIWLLSKIENLRTFINDSPNDGDFLSLNQLQKYRDIRGRLKAYLDEGFTSYFECESFGKLGGLYIASKGFMFHSPSLIIETYYD